MINKNILEHIYKQNLLIIKKQSTSLYHINSIKSFVGLACDHE